MQFRRGPDARAIGAASLLLVALACGGDNPNPVCGTAGLTSPCGGGGEGEKGIVVPANPPLTAGTATTPTVAVTLDQGAAATATIDVEGGSIVAHGTGGTTFTLAVPPGALLTPTQITVTPVTSMSGSALAQSSVGTVDLAPSGLRLLRDATLRVELGAAPTARVAGIGYSGTGADFHLMPAIAAAAGARVFDLPISHFSGAGLTSATPAAINALARDLAATAQGRIEQQLGAVLAKKNGEPLTDADVAQIQSLLRDFYAQVAKPQLLAAQVDDAQLEAAVQSYFEWERAAALLGMEFAAEQAEGRALVMSGMVNRYRKAYGRCAQGRDFTQVKMMVEVARFLQLFGSDALPQSAAIDAAGCAAMRLEYTSTLSLSNAWTFQTSGQVPLQNITIDGNPVSSTHRLVNFSLAPGFTACPANVTYANGSIVVYKFAFEPDKQGIKNVSLAYDPEIGGGPTATARYKCTPISPEITVPFLYASPFVVLHYQEEFKDTPRPAYYVTTGWEAGSGDVLARRRYSRNVNGYVEDTEIIIRHTPAALP